VNFDDDAPTLLDWLGPIADEWKEFQFDKCRLAARHIFDLNCNWALKAFGRRVGVPILGLVWAAWHLVPTFLKVGLFPELEAAPPLMLLAFVGACLIYRELLTRFVERSCSWLGAAAGHAAPNLMFTGFIAWGLVILERPEAWQWFPAPGGLVFPALALAAVLALRRRTSTVAA
jgi:hypothetical protein